MRKLSVIGNEFRHCLYSNNPLPPVSSYSELQWDWDSLSNSVVFTESAMENVDIVNATHKVAWLIEPQELIPHKYQWVANNNHKFKYVFTHEKTLLDKGNNYRFIPFGGCWIPEQDRKIHPKTKLVSIIASGKTQLTGHKLRHRVIEVYKDRIDVFGNGYNPVPNKIVSLRDYAFSVVIENTKRDYWFTEKLIDSLITGTIPIYWGCPSIGDFFDTRGMIIWDSVDELDSILHDLSFQKYNEIIPYVLKNQEIANQYVLAEKFIDEQYIQTGEL